MVTTEIKKLSVTGKNLFEFFPFAAQQVYLLLFAKDASPSLRLNLALENIPMFCLCGAQIKFVKVCGYRGSFSVH